MTQVSGVVSVVLIEDQPGVRHALSVLIDGSPGFRCIAAFRSMEDALRALEHKLPDVVLTDIGLPGMSGVDGIRVLKERHPVIPVVALTVYDDDENIFDAICAGASGYLLKTTPPARLLESLQEVVSGGAPMSPEIAHRVLTLFRQFRPPERAAHTLTPHETDLLKLIVQGHSYKSAAAELGVSVSTVSFHLQNIYSKLQVHSKSEAVAKALRSRLI